MGISLLIKLSDALTVLAVKGIRYDFICLAWYILPR